jgi:peptidoglycan/xylan/chitin deacetylase (PgdA/CDA1 family)
MVALATLGGAFLLPSLAGPAVYASSPIGAGGQPALVDPVVVAPPARVIAHGSRARPVVALTFDDGWDADATRRILSILEAEHVTATFFPYGIAVRRHPGLWQRIADAGFPIGNHTQSHPDLTRLGAAGVRAQFRVDQQTVEPIIGRELIPFARPPFGAWNETTAQAASADGYRALVLWDVDSRDWSGLRASAIVSRATAGRNGSIVLMHAGPEQTVHALKSIIASYRARGFDFVTVPEILGMATAQLPPLAGAREAAAPSGLGLRFR